MIYSVRFACMVALALTLLSACADQPAKAPEPKHEPGSQVLMEEKELDAEIATTIETESLNSLR